MELSTNDGNRDLLEKISHTYTQDRDCSVQAVNTQIFLRKYQLYLAHSEALSCELE